MSRMLLTTLYSTLSKAKANAASLAINEQWPCKTAVASNPNGLFEVYVIGGCTLTDHQKQAIPQWAAGYIYAKFGE